jgi:hypothetical protein
MKYFIDTEFLEGKQKEVFPISLFRKESPNTIDLISIGIVAEDDREYYAISKDFNLKEAWNRYDLKDNTDSVGYRIGVEPSKKKEYWIRENVLLPIYYDLLLIKHPEKMESNYGNYENFKGHVLRNMSNKIFKEFKSLINRYGKPNKEIAEEIKDFIYKDHFNRIYFDNNNEIHKVLSYKDETEMSFYAYYADYDWVAFCWLFGKMIDLPDGFPKYCKDLKQELDVAVNNLNWYYYRDIWSNEPKSIKTIGKDRHQEKDKPARFDEKLKVIQTLEEYPKQKNEHNALADARWNKELFNFISLL